MNLENIVKAEYYTNNFDDDGREKIMVTFSDGKISCYHMDGNNSDTQELKKWIADGGTVIDNRGGE
jgi:hypothetical protein